MATTVDKKTRKLLEITTGKQYCKDGQYRNSYLKES